MYNMRYRLQQHAHSTCHTIHAHTIHALATPHTCKHTLHYTIQEIQAERKMQSNKVFLNKWLFHKKQYLKMSQMCSLYGIEHSVLLFNWASYNFLVFFWYIGKNARKCVDAYRVFTTRSGHIMHSHLGHIMHSHLGHTIHS